MSVAELLAELRRRDIEIALDGEQMRLRAPTGAVTPQLRDLLRERKPEIVHFLRSAQALADQPRAIVPLQAKGTRVPVFGVPGHNGDVFCYREFAQALDEDQPFFGLQPPGLDGSSTPLASVEAIAAYFASQILALHPRGPCIVAGFCGGGTVAFELAQQLQAAAGNVQFVALIGAPYPTFFRAPSVRRRILHKIERVQQHAGELASRSWSERRLYIAQTFGAAKPVDTDVADEVLRLRANVEEATLAAVRAYEPRHFAGRVCLLLPSKYWVRAGFGALDWRSVALETDEYFGPDGSTGDNMLREHRAGAFADLFRRACIDAMSDTTPPTHTLLPRRALA